MPNQTGPQKLIRETETALASVVYLGLGGAVSVPNPNHPSAAQNLRAAAPPHSPPSPTSPAPPAPPKLQRFPASSGSGGHRGGQGGSGRPFGRGTHPLPSRRRRRNAPPASEPMEHGSEGPAAATSAGRGRGAPRRQPPGFGGRGAVIRGRKQQIGYLVVVLLQIFELRSSDPKN